MTTDFIEIKIPLADTEVTSRDLLTYLTQTHCTATFNLKNGQRTFEYNPVMSKRKCRADLHRGYNYTEQRDKLWMVHRQLLLRAYFNR